MKPQDIKYLYESYLDIYEGRGSKPSTSSDAEHFAGKLGERAAREAKRNPKKASEIIGRYQSGAVRLQSLSPSGTQAYTAAKRGFQRGSRKQQETFELIINYLLDEGYADCLGSAEIILENMSDEWLNDIVEEFIDPERGETPSGRTPIEKVAEHPNKKVRRKAILGFLRQMEKEYGGKWKAKTLDPTQD